MLIDVLFSREIHDKMPKKRPGLKASEMKLILNWKLAGEAQVIIRNRLR